MACNKNSESEFSSSEWKNIEWNKVAVPYNDMVTFSDEGSISISHPSPWLASGSLGKTAFGEIEERYTYQTESRVQINYKNVDFDNKTERLSFPKKRVPVSIYLEGRTVGLCDVFAATLEGSAFFVGNFGSPEKNADGAKVLPGELQVFFKGDDGTLCKFKFNDVVLK